MVLYYMNLRRVLVVSSCIKFGDAIGAVEQLFNLRAGSVFDPLLGQLSKINVLNWLRYECAGHIPVYSDLRLSLRKNTL